MKGEEARATMSLRPSERAEVRRNLYKVAVDTEEGHCRREDNVVEIRKSRCEESLLKKLRDDLSPSAAAAALQMAHSSTLQQKGNMVEICKSHREDNMVEIRKSCREESPLEEASRRPLALRRHSRAANGPLLRAPAEVGGFAGDGPGGALGRQRRAAGGHHAVPEAIIHQGTTLTCWIRRWRRCGYCSWRRPRRRMTPPASSSSNSPRPSPTRPTGTRRASRT